MCGLAFKIYEDLMLHSHLRIGLGSLQVYHPRLRKRFSIDCIVTKL